MKWATGWGFDDVVFFIILTAGILGSGFLMMGCANQGKAEAYAQEYAAVNYPGEELNGAICELGDSDGDGRVRCNISLRGPQGTHVENVECPGGWLWQPFKTTCVGIKARAVRF